MARHSAAAAAAASACLPILLVLAGPADAASFDCGKAGSAVERSICSTPALDAADAAMGAGYKALIGALAADEAGRGFARAEQRAWTLRRNRACGFDAKAGNVAGSGHDDPADCLQAETERRTRELAALRAYPALGARLRKMVLTEGHPGSRLYIRAERPEIADPAYPGAAAFNDTARRFVDGEIRRFRESSADLPKSIEAELILAADAYVVTSALVSVQFRGEGVQGNGFRYAAALTMDLVRGDAPTVERMFGGEGWRAAAIGACRKELAADPNLVPECDGPDLWNPLSWRFEPGRAVATLLLPGKELREISIPFHPPAH